MPPARGVGVALDRQAIAASRIGHRLIYRTAIKYPLASGKPKATHTEIAIAQKNKNKMRIIPVHCVRTECRKQH